MYMDSRCKIIVASNRKQSISLPYCNVLTNLQQRVQSGVTFCRRCDPVHLVGGLPSLLGRGPTSSLRSDKGWSLRCMYYFRNIIILILNRILRSLQSFFAGQLSLVLFMIQDLFCSFLYISRFYIAKSTECVISQEDAVR